MHFFVTGHTGFKGAWLISLLKAKGHKVSGYSLPPAAGGLFAEASMKDDLENHTIGDVRDLALLRLSLNRAMPDVVIHLAAQPLVRRSYEDPMDTYSTNVQGTLNLLQVVTELNYSLVTLVITTDKVYRDSGELHYSEGDPLGGHDAYSASKAMADILTQSWAATHPELKLHVARAGNVIGAFDVSTDRLIPDVNRALVLREPIRVRNPESVRPWQHVLDCLNGYLEFIDASFRGAELPIALNFGPESSETRSVSEVLRVAKNFEATLKVQTVTQRGLKETSMLTLDSSEARRILGWKDKIKFEEAVRMSLYTSIENARTHSERVTAAFLKS